MKYRALVVTLLALCLSVLTACSGGASAKAPELLTYDDIRNTGLAVNCPSLPETARGAISLDQGDSYKITGLCLQPTEYFVKEESTNKRQEAEFINSRLLTRRTYSLDQVGGRLRLGSDGSLTFTEEYGIDFQPITVQLPGGEQVPFLFTIKGLVAQSQAGLTSINTSTDFEGKFNVPSYRGSTFLDPKGRGLASGYDNAVALPATSDEEEFLKANIKQADTLMDVGQISLQISKIDGETGEIAGIFESEQPSDTDLGMREALEVKVRGVFYARIEQDA
ncbi:MAG: Photosystem II manganese-stabilizing polypeptide [Oscillatoriales cyanobacterium RM2_1_1]|nr:Photosystem II manganese-stabilizing polypeptide [Oscillatoriales cyanobacterium SM2_3_0]NJO46682.1 Photosystem II manganese-stabilizing polypeptide [Oscillatoriales cyanobacterium RM2_1_1]